jgi:3-isopropylmalate dehydrogenase
LAGTTFIQALDGDADPRAVRGSGMTGDPALTAFGMAGDPALTAFAGPDAPLTAVAWPNPALTYRIALIPGDGVGPEVIAGAVSVLETVGGQFGFGFAWQELTVGGAGIDAYGVAIRPEDVEVCRGADAVLLGAVGGPKWDDPDAAVRPEQALFALRGGLGLFANLRPITVNPSLISASPLKPELLEGVDCLIVRELTSGLYFGRPSEQRVTPRGERAAIDTLWYTEGEIRQIVTLAFELARGRRSKLTSVDKANVLATSRLWRKVTEEVHADFPDVALDHRLVDSAAMVLASRPAGFDVLVTENLFGDILSDEGAVVAGSLGMLPSASLGSRTTAFGRFGLYEPIHGTAPDIAGQDIANPLGMILSSAMMLRWSLGQATAADAIEAAVNGVLEDGFRTKDLVPSDAAEAAACTVVGTKEMARVIGDRIAI